MEWITPKRVVTERIVTYNYYLTLILQSPANGMCDSYFCLPTTMDENK